MIWLQGSSCPVSGFSCPCYLLPIPSPLQASLMACGGVVSDGGMSAHASRRLLAGFLGAADLQGCPDFGALLLSLGKSHQKSFSRILWGPDAPGSQSCSWRCCKSGGGGFSCHRPEVWRVFLAALLCRLVVTLPRVLAPCSSLLGTVGQGRVGFGLQASRHTPCNLVVAGDAGKCSGEDPAPGGPSGVLHMWCNPSKGAGLVGIQPGDPHAEF